MRPLFLILLLSILSSTYRLHAQVNPGPDIAWQECFGGESNDFFTDAILLPSGSFVVNLHATSFMEYEYYGSWLVVFDDEFNEIWRHEPSDECLPSTMRDVELLTNNSIVVFGNTGGCNDSIGEVDFGVFCIDQDGTKLWSRSYGSTQNDDSHTLLPTSDGGFLVGGSTRGFDGDLYMPAWNDLFFNDAVIMKMDSMGEVEWVDIVGGTGDDIVLSNFLKVAPDQFLVLIGSSSSDYDLAGSDVDDLKKYLLRIYDSDGNVIKENVISAENNIINNYNKLLLLPDGNILIAGTATAESDINPTFPEHLHLEGAIGIIDEDLELADLHLFGGTGFDYFTSIIPASTSGYYCLGITTSIDFDIAESNGSWDVWVSHLNDELNILWSRGIGSAGDDIFNFRSGALIEVDNMLYIFDQVSAQAGNPTGDLTCGDPSTNKVDAWLVALDLSTVSIEPVPGLSPIQLFPNPVSQTLTIQLPDDLDENVSYNIIDITGSVVESGHLQHQTNQLNLMNYPNGVYVINVYMDGHRYSQLSIKE